MKWIASIWRRFFDWLTKDDYEKTDEDGSW